MRKLLSSFQLWRRSKSSHQPCHRPDPRRRQLAAPLQPVRRGLPLVIILLTSSAAAQMAPNPMMAPPPVSSTDPGMVNRPGMNSTPTVTYDAATHERITYLIDRNTGGFVEGLNTETRKAWRADIRSDGSMSGKDVDGDRWKYDRHARLYTNLATGKTCDKTSLRRVCGP